MLGGRHGAWNQAHPGSTEIRPGQIGDAPIGPLNVGIRCGSIASGRRTQIGTLKIGMRRGRIVQGRPTQISVGEVRVGEIDSLSVSTITSRVALMACDFFRETGRERSPGSALRQPERGDRQDLRLISVTASPAFGRGMFEPRMVTCGASMTRSTLTTAQSSVPCCSRATISLH